MTDILSDSRTNDTPAKTRWGQERRLEFIDFRLQWEGRLNRSDVTEFFGISVPQASLDLARYMELAPTNMEYDRREKIYQATPSYVPVLTSNDAQSYFIQLLAIDAGILNRDTSFCGWIAPVGAVHFPHRETNATALKLALQAIRSSRTLRITYQSMNRTAPSERSISPHAFGFDGFRWHLRAYCHEREEFRDFVFARMLNISLGESSEINPNEDEAWSREVDLVLAPHPDLSEAQRRAIELDYGMQSGQMTLHTRQALLFYVVRQLRLDQNSGTAPQAQQIILVNRDELLPLLSATP
jgi:predicted DNA-binding transcriptional regulator YafY